MKVGVFTAALGDAFASPFYFPPKARTYFDAHAERIARLLQFHALRPIFCFPLGNETAVFKLLYLRVQELYAKWNNRMIPGWSNVRNQLEMDERMSALMHKYDKAD